ncbi:MAG TPA: zinc ribbon-containing protein [Gammaproteobacteria bacterium]|nr:zinc ribbon-containing protein [Gammaproteobacteria bacterium]
MSKTTHIDPIDALGAAYEKMFERAAENLHSAEVKTAPLLHKLIDEARDEAIALGELSENDAAKLAGWLKRDLDDAISYLAETGHELKDWLGFETTLLENATLDLLLRAADKTTVELSIMKENFRRASTYTTGEITGVGTLVCEQCAEKLHFHKTGRIPPCPRCHSTTFHR